jgi:integrase
MSTSWGRLGKVTPPPGRRYRCRSLSDQPCDCAPRWEAWVYCRADRAKVRKSFAEYWEAKAWRQKQLELASDGLLRTPSRRTLAEIASLWITLAQEGRIRNRSAHRYKPSALRTIEIDLRLYLVHHLGSRRIASITRADLQRLVDGRLNEGLSPSKTRAIVNAAWVLWRDFDLLAAGENQLPTAPIRGLRLPANSPWRERIASPAEANRLIQALPQRDRALWATAMYAGLRLGELRALQARDVDLAHRRIHISRSWDQYEGEVAPKSVHGTRSTIITKPLQLLLTEHVSSTRRKDSDLIFGRTPTTPFNSTTIYLHAYKAWAAANQTSSSAGEQIRPIGLHDCRHSAVSQMLDAGIPMDKVSKFIGHGPITITIDRYGHLLPGGEAEALALPVASTTTISAARPLAPTAVSGSSSASRLY